MWKKKSSKAKIEALLREGLDHYGMGEPSKAFECWTRVLELDPKNEDARDYMRSADRRSRTRPPKSAAVQEFVAEGRRLVADGELEQALELFQNAAVAEPGARELQGYIDLLRSRLHREYREALGGLRGVPTLAVDADRIRDLELPQHAGFVVSLIDGTTSMTELVSLSGLDPVEAFRTLRELIAQEIVSVSA
ncbi:MAG: tetratricopeptide repeat protein [Proteobacteria bacterium]|nr:tetratricopeptide repeat protein [Pseudomonadota bacterium]